MVLPNSTVSFLNSATYFTTPLYKPKIANEWIELKKFLKFPIKANPSGPIKIAMAFDVKNPEIILTKTEVEFKDATLMSTLLFM